MTWVGQQELLILEGEQVSLVSEVRGGRNRSGPVSGWEATCTEEATSPQGWCWICRPARLERCCICRLRAQSRLAGRLQFGNWVCETFHAASQLLHGQGRVEEKESRKALPFLGWFEFLIPSCDNFSEWLGSLSFSLWWVWWVCLGWRERHHERSSLMWSRCLDWGTWTVMFVGIPHLTGSGFGFCSYTVKMVSWFLSFRYPASRRPAVLWPGSAECSSPVSHEQPSPQRAGAVSARGCEQACQCWPARSVTVRSLAGWSSVVHPMLIRRCPECQFPEHWRWAGVGQEVAVDLAVEDTCLVGASCVQSGETADTAGCSTQRTLPGKIF